MMVSHLMGKYGQERQVTEEGGSYAVSDLEGRSMQIIFEPEKGGVVLRDGEHKCTLVVVGEEYDLCLS